MDRARIGLAFSIALAACACAGVPRAPDWYAEGPACEKQLAGGDRRFCASALAATAEDARASAIAQALAHAASGIQTEIHSTFELDTSCVSVEGGGVSTARCEESARSTTRSGTRRMAFRELDVEKLEVKPGAGGQHGWAIVRIPRKEWARLARAARGKLLVAVDCKAGDGACPQQTLDALTSALSECGFGGLAGLATDVDSPQAAVRRALEADAGRALYISLRAQLQGLGDAREIEGSGRWELLDTGDAKSIAAKGIPALRRPVAADALAISDTLRTLVSRLSTISCGLSDAKGSLCCARSEIGDR